MIKQEERIEDFSSIELAQKEKDFFNNLGVNSESGEMYSQMNCDGSLQSLDLDLDFSANSWVILAYASMYKANPSDILIRDIMKKEKQLLDFYEDTYVSDIRLLVMGHHINTVFQLLKRDNVLEKPADFKKMLSNDVRYYFEHMFENGRLSFDFLQVTAMHSISFSDIYLNAEDYGFTEAEKQNILIEAGLWYDEAKAKLDERPLEGCWVKLAGYYYEKAKGNDNTENIDFFNKPLSETILNENSVVSPVLIQPCIETLINLYRDTGDTSYLNKAKEATAALYKVAEGINEGCSSESKFAVPYNYNEEDSSSTQEELNVYLLSDNSYMIFLLSQPEMVDFSYEK